MGKNKDTILLKIDGELRDLSFSPEDNSEIEEISYDSTEALEIYKHSCAHLLAQAVTELYPGSKYGIGPAVENGFYYDFITSEPFTPEDLDKITKKMRFLVKQNIKIENKILKKEESVKMFRERGQLLKVELIEEKVDSDDVSVYQQGDFTDLCRGPHLPSTGFLKNFKLTSIASSYWKGDENNSSMQRVYGVVFPTDEQLKDHLEKLKEAKKRDHRKLGKELDLFSISEDTGAGLVLWHPKGSMVRHEIEKFWYDEHLKNGYQLVNTPHIARYELWDTSGHNSFYTENMFTPIEFDNTKYRIKPMNCPFHVEIFKSRNRSYREMPFRWAELGTVYRYERSGVLHGLLRVRGFTQDDAHHFCTPGQLDGEVEKLIDFSLKMLNKFGFEELEIYLSTRPEKFVGEISEWEEATGALKGALERLNVNYQIDPGEGVFYGPKIDIKVKDQLRRSWQCTTIQVDFNLPERFNLKYSDNDGKIKKPIMIHRALLGSLERFFGVLIEHYGGAFPLWLAPVQVIILPVSDKNHNYSNELEQKISEKGLRVEVDDRNEGIGRKIRDAENMKIPFILIIGDEEENEGNISFRIHKKGDQGKVAVTKFIKEIERIREEKCPEHEIQ
ncbi:MAG: threonine--tRNA ligase [Acidobacteriota bacterium]